MKNDPHSAGTFWMRSGVILSLVTLGVSQIFYSLVTANLYAFPHQLRFYLWSIMWIQLVPFVLLMCLELLLIRKNSTTMPYRLWRTFLVMLLALSITRQFQVFYEPQFQWITRWIAPQWIFAIVTLGACMVTYRFTMLVSQYLSYAGFLSLLLPLAFLYQTGMVSWNSVIPSHERPRHAAAPSEIPVFIVVFDELSYDALLKNGKLDSDSFPNFARLVADGIWFANATTNHWATIDSIPAITTGKILPDAASHTLFQRMETNFESTMITTEMEVENWFQSSGYAGIDESVGKTHQLIRNPLLTGAYLWGRMNSFLFAKSSEAIILDDASYHVTLQSEFSSFLEQIRGGPQFVFWHCSVPHSPFIFNADGSSIHKPPTVFPFTGEFDPAQFPVIFQRYRVQAQYADRLLGKFLEELKKKQLYDRSIILVTSDHGVRVWGSIFRYAFLTAHVPLILRAPGLAAATRVDAVQSVDIAPTIMELAKVAFSPSEFDGISLLHSQDSQHRKRQTYFFPANYAYDVDTDSMRDVPIQMTQNITRKGNAKQEDSEGNNESELVHMSPPVNHDQFSGLMVLEDIHSARNTHRDFLTLYLAKDFPLRTDAAYASARQQLEALETEPQNPTFNFRRGMFYFFLALSDTYSLYRGEKRDIEEVDQNWKLAQHWFLNTGDLQSWPAEEVGRLIAQADRDENESLDAKELQEMISDRLGPPANWPVSTIPSP